MNVSGAVLLCRCCRTTPGHSLRARVTSARMFIEGDIDARLDACLAAIEAVRALGVDWKTLGMALPGLVAARAVA